METDYVTAEDVKIERVITRISYLPLYTMDNDFWMIGYLCDTEQQAIDSVKHDATITRLRIVKIELPLLNVPENIDIG